MSVPIAIVGPRSYTRYSRVFRLVSKLAATIPDLVVVSGGAKGTDTLAELAAKRLGVPTLILKPDWSKGRGAGLMRNTKIVSNAIGVIAFWDGVSTGTADTINKAEKAGKLLKVIYV